MWTGINSRSHILLVNFDKDNDGAISQTEAKYRSSTPIEEQNGKKYKLEMDWSVDKLVRTADVDKDGKATRAEIEAVMKRYDKNGDGDLPTRGILGILAGKFWKQEGDKYESAFGARATNRREVPLN